MGRRASGLGQHIVHRMMVDRFKGHLVLNSEPGAGTTVRLMVPRSIKFGSDSTTSP
jgi:signal transduction histidine kinase